MRLKSIAKSRLRYCELSQGIPVYNYSVQSKQNGAVLLILIGSVLAILVVFAITFFIMQRNAVRAFAASVSNSAALAAASALSIENSCEDGAECTSRDRWNAAQKLALAGLGNTFPTSGLIPVSNAGLKSLLQIDPGTLPANSPPSFQPSLAAQSNKLSVTIERGRWESNLRDGQTSLFVSLEDREAAKLEYPGLPRFIGFNAVKVTVTIKENTLPAPLSKLLGETLSFAVSKSSVALAQRDSVVQAAPFAIPVCSLVERDSTTTSLLSLKLLKTAAEIEDASSDFNPTNICYADRIMAPISRYCAAAASDPGCRGVVPQFNWDPNNHYMSREPVPSYPRRSENTSYWPTTEWKPGSNGARVNIGVRNAGKDFQRMCFWGSPRYLEPEDNFGIVGAPVIELVNQTPVTDCSTVLSEDAIIAALNNEASQGLLNSFIGSKFCPLQNGLTNQASQAALAHRITAPRKLAPNDVIVNRFNLQMNNGDVDAPKDPIAVNLNTDSLNPLTPPLNIMHAFTANSSGRSAGCIWPVDNGATNATFNPIGYQAVANSTTNPRARWPRTWSRYGPNYHSTRLEEYVRSDESVGTITGRLAPELEGGTCNSWRTGWGFWLKITEQFNKTTSKNAPWFYYWRPTGVNPNTKLSNVTANYPPLPGENDLYDGHLDTLPVWNPWVAVVADTSKSATPCSGTNLSPPPVVPPPAYDPVDRDPTLSTAPMTIIGYLRLTVFDMDIGELSPSPQVSGAAPFTGVNFPYTHAAYTHDGRYAWNFRRPDLYNATSNPRPHCNLVRTRLSCRQPPVPLAGGGDEVIRPRLVLETPDPTKTPVPK